LRQHRVVVPFFFWEIDTNAVINDDKKGKFFMDDKLIKDMMTTENLI